MFSGYGLICRNLYNSYDFPLVTKEVGHERLSKNKAIENYYRNRVNKTNPGHVLTRNGFRKVI